MPVTYLPFESEHGFKSPGFSVNSSGALSAVSVDAQTITLNGSSISTSLGSNPTFQSVYVEGTFEVGTGTTEYLSVTNGQVVISNKTDSVGSIDNVNIGANIPGTGSFTSISTVPLGIPKFESDTNLIFSVGNALVVKVNGITLGTISSNGSNIPIRNTTINNTVIGGTTPTTATFTTITATSVSATSVSATNLSATNAPTSNSHLTRKDYVDNKITALAIALGV